ncbi:putative RNA polymerase II transcriptional coactivator [Pseudolycoriella hygida]|uniref:RNA polymerase II transcriptional coactivator n=1 Tax=Pseudolycoriella hygida TaxID=35572 RepID=A0A9Q0N8T9_9DIPT|nr:putative RNA polymerase II transcriptional coactivator [Pseudolycoriella hygida]
MSPKRSKKAKLSESESASSSSASESESSAPTPPRKDAKKSKSEKETAGKSEAKSAKSDSSLRVRGETEPTWELGGKKFLKVNDFKGKTYVNIREYYEKDGKVLPGKKGISLNLEQWQNFCSSIDEVNKVLRK